MHQDSRKKTAIENIYSHKHCDIIAAGLCEIREKFVVVGWSQLKGKESDFKLNNTGY